MREILSLKKIVDAIHFAVADARILSQNFCCACLSVMMPKITNDVLYNMKELNEIHMSDIQEKNIISSIGNRKWEVVFFKYLEKHVCLVFKTVEYGIIHISINLSGSRLLGKNLKKENIKLFSLKAKFYVFHHLENNFDL